MLAAVQVFAGNLRDLLLAAPAGARPTMGLDPGYRTGAKVAVVTATGQRTRLVNRMKGTLARLGIRNFRPTLRTAAEHLAALSNVAPECRSRTGARHRAVKVGDWPDQANRGGSSTAIRRTA